MRSRSSPEREAAVARRLELLSAELARAGGVDAGRYGGDDGAPEGDDTAWADGIETERAPREPEPAGPGPEPGRVPVPGRHAARRPRPGPGSLLPETLRGRFSLGPGQVAVIAVLVAVGLAVTAWWVVRGDSREMRSTSPSPAALQPTGSSSPEPLVAATGAADPPDAAAAPTTEATAVTVDVAGKVRRPGIVELTPGARVADALDAAGGPRRGVDLTTLNLARPLTDGEQVLVGVTPPPGVAARATESQDAGAGGPEGLVSLNTATLAELETVPQVGPVTAQAILDWRTEHGGFSAVDELLEVSGIGEATLEKIAPHVTL